MSFDKSEKFSKDAGEGQAPRGKGGFRRRKSCPFSGPEAPVIDWKDVKMLSRYISERGKIMPSRITNVCMTKQRELAKAIKRARFMALMPYVRDELPPRPERIGDRPERGERGDRPERGERSERPARNTEA